MNEIYNGLTDSNEDDLDENYPIAKLIEMILSAVQNALIYGYRVRFLHSLAYQLATIKPQTEIIDIFLKIWKSVTMGLDHGKILAFFAVIYRCSLALTKKSKLFVTKDTKLINNFIAGFIGGVLVYSGVIQRKTVKNIGENKKSWIKKILLLNDNILTQITMYTMSRLIIAVGKDLAYLTIKVNTNKKMNRILKTKQVEKITEISWTVCCGIIWGGIMVYYQRDRNGNDNINNNNNKNNNGKPSYLPRALQFSLDFIYGGVTHAWKEAFDYNNR